MGQARDEAGNVWETDAQGNAVRLIRAAGGSAIVGAPDPRIPRQEARADRSDARAERSEARAAQTAAQSAATQVEQLRIAQARLVADLRKEGMQLGPDGVTPVPIEGWQRPLSADQQVEMRGRISRLNQLAGQIDRVQTLYDQGPGRTSGVRGIFDYLPSDANAAFDTAGAALSQQGLAAFRVPGTGTVSDRDAMMFDRANLPEASTRDAAIEEQLRGLRARVDEELSSLGMQPRWGDDGKRIEQRDPLGATYLDNAGAPRQAAGFFATEEMKPIPAEMQAEYTAFMGKWVTAPDVGEYVRFRNALDQKYGYPLRGDDAHAQFATDAFKRIQSGQGATIGTGIPGTMEPMNEGKIAANVLLNNPITVTAMNAGDSLLMGAPGALTRALVPGSGEAMAAVNADNPLSTLTGQVIGAIGGTKGIGALGANAARRLGPAGERLLGTGARSGYASGTTGQVARNIATDATYGAGVTATSGGNPLEGAVIGGLASLGGQGLGSLVGRGLSGVTSSPTVSRLRDLDVIPTLGQIMRGRASDTGGRSFVAGLEDSVANTPALGSLVQGARGNALEQANAAGYRIGAEGAPISGIGLPAVEQLGRVRSTAYDDAFAGTSLPVDEQRFAQQIADINPGRGANEFQSFMDNKLVPTIGDSSAISGRRLQEALRMLRTNRNQYRTAATMNPAMGDVADAIGGVENAFIGNAARNAPGAIPKLKMANRLNRNFNILDDAAGNAANQGGVWTGAQLGQSIAKDAQRFSGGRGITRRAKSGLHQLQQDMQAVLPNQVPPTGVNSVPVAGLLAGVGAGGYGAGEALDSPMLKSLAVLSLLATPYTKLGSKAVAKALLDRPASVRAIGSKVRQKKGLFGAAAVPLGLELQQ